MTASSEPRLIARIGPIAASRTAVPGRRSPLSVASASAMRSSCWSTCPRRWPAIDAELSSGASVPNVALQASLAFTSSVELDALLRAGRTLPGTGCCWRRSPWPRDRWRRVERLALAGRLDLPRAQQGQDEQADHLEVPAEWLLGELVGEVPAGRGVAVARRAPRSGASTSRSGPSSSVEDDLAPLVLTRPRLPKTGGRPWRFSAVSSASSALLDVDGLAAASLKRSKTSGSTSSRTPAALLPTSVAPARWAAVVAAEVDAAVQERLAEQAPELVLVAAEPQLLLGDERRLDLASGRRAPCGRASPWSGRARRSRGRSRRSARRPEDRLPFFLAARPQLRREELEYSTASSASWTWKAMSPSITDRPWMARPALKVRASSRLCEGCGCQKPVRTSVWRRCSSPGLGLMLARIRSQSSSAGVGMR